MAALAAAAAENPAPAHDAAVTAADFRRTGVQGAKCVHLGAAFLVSSPQGKTKSLFASVAYSLDSLAARFAFSRASLRFARFILLEELVSGKVLPRVCCSACGPQTSQALFRPRTAASFRLIGRMG